MPETPKRIQRKRTKGWRMPPNTVSVTRPGKWGNPYRVGEPHPHPDEGGRAIRDATEAVELYRLHLSVLGMLEGVGDSVDELRGKNLACFCPLDAPCHADVLLEIATQQEPRDAD